MEAVIYIALALIVAYALLRAQRADVERRKVRVTLPVRRIPPRRRR
jgi:hypothetical protein